MSSDAAAALAAGLREYADFVEQHPEVAAGPGGLSLTLLAYRPEPFAVLARALDREVTFVENVGTRARVVRCFGPLKVILDGARDDVLVQQVVGQETIDKVEWTLAEAAS